MFRAITFRSNRRDRKGPLRMMSLCFNYKGLSGDKHYREHAVRADFPDGALREPAAARTRPGNTTVLPLAA
jgi:hypothetical protein